MALIDALLRFEAGEVPTDEARSGSDVSPSPRDEHHSSVSLQRVGRSWLVSHGVTKVTVHHLVGFGYLAALLANPGREIRCSVLASGVDLGSASKQPLLDLSARQSLEARSACRAGGHLPGPGLRR